MDHGWWWRVRGALCIALLALSCTANDDRKLLGDSCARGEECESGRCDELVCKSASPAGLGEVCSHPLECASEICVGSRCAVAPADGGQSEAGLDGGQSEAGSSDSGLVVDGLAPGDLSTGPAAISVQPGAVSLAWGWTWHNPLPLMAVVDRLWGLDANNVWAVGDKGAVLHFDGTRWTGKQLDLQLRFHDVWAASPSDIWVVGGRFATFDGPGVGEVWRYDGTRWGKASYPLTSTVNTIWGASASDIWSAAGDQIAHFDGSRWTEAASPTLGSVSDIWGSATDDIWAVDGSDRLLHYDGSGWQLYPYRAPGGLERVFGASATEVWAAGSDGIVVRFDGTSWAPVAFPDTSQDLVGLWVGQQGRPSVSSCSAVFSFDGQRWLETALPGVPTRACYALWGSAEDDLWAVGGNNNGFDQVRTRMLHLEGDEWKEVSSSISDADLEAVYARTPDDVWAVGQDAEILHYDGSAWSVDFAPVSTTLKGVWAHGATNAWAVGFRGTLLHYDGTSWREVSSPTSAPLAGIYGSAADDIWVVGEADTITEQPTILHYDGTQWQAEADLPSTNEVDLAGIWGSAATDIWVVGWDKTRSRPIRWHFDGTSWAADDPKSGAGARYAAIAGSGPSDIWACGGATFDHGVGQPPIWTSATYLESYHRPMGLFGARPDDFWGVGYIDAVFWWDAAIYHYDGTDWTALEEVGPVSFSAISGTSATDIWVVGSGGAILHLE